VAFSMMVLPAQMAILLLIVVILGEGKMVKVSVVAVVPQVLLELTLKV